MKKKLSKPSSWERVTKPKKLAKPKKTKLPKGEQSRDNDIWCARNQIDTIQKGKVEIGNFTKKYINSEFRWIVSDLEAGRIINGYNRLMNLSKILNTEGQIFDIVKHYWLDDNNQIKGKAYDISIFEETHRATSFKPNLYHDIPRPISEGARNKLHKEMISDLERFGYKVTKDKEK